ncbi:PREDICTED: uncharacterized protein LOC109234743 [Nicotiana attenuata]|uniref:uncharacterized protein LOC109234743 n=1 Tax=Nicotiana attenuata TaxID=49451 RepID=UPI000905194A|nr:PREDICTED: uncharacterized protein LOC109234743 [Nicotiana attenuata]
MEEEGQQLKYLKLAFTGLLYSKMQGIMSPLAINARESLDELEEFRLSAYENTKLYKEKTKKWHDKLIHHKDFKVGDQVLLYNSRLRLFPGKFKSRWTGPYTVTGVTPYGAIEVQHTDGGDKFKVNSHRLKPYIFFDKHASTILLA